MADYNSYAQQAASIYDPQLQAEIANLSNKTRSTLFNLDTEQKQIEPAYQKALRGINEQVRGEEGRINQLYSQRLGGMFSGLQGNDLGMMYSKANQNRTDIETTRADKLASIAGRRTLAKQEEATSANALRSRYTGLKNQYAQQAYNDALQAEEQRRQFNEQMALRRSEAARSSASSSMPSTSQFLVQAFSGYDPHAKSFYTEHEVIPALMANYGLSKDAAAKLAYQYRKQVYNE